MGILSRTRPGRASGGRYGERRDVGESVTMNMLDLFGFACGAVGLFGLACKTEDRIGRILMFVLAALNLVFLLLGLFT